VIISGAAFFISGAPLLGGPDHAREHHRCSAPGKSRMTAEVIDLASIRSAREARDAAAAEPSVTYGEVWTEMVGLGCAVAQLGCDIGIELMLHSGIPQAPCDVEG
jgi:hypothetical protein